MRAPVFKSRQQCLLARFCMLLLLGSAIAVSGCHRGAYRAAELPSEYQAPPNISAASLDLSRVAGPRYSTNTIQRGDVLEVQVSTGLENPQEELANWKLRVGDDGKVVVPLIGHVQLAGMQLANADDAIRRASIERGIFRKPNVAVQMDKPLTNKVAVLGAVKEPGPYELPVASSNVLSAIAEAGGITDDADTIIEVRHPSGQQQYFPRDSQGNISTAGYQRQSARPRSHQIDLVAATSGQPTDVHLEDGSVVMVMKRPLRAIYVGGLVKAPDQYDMPKDTDLFLVDAISMAGGRKFEFADQITIIRRVPGTAEPVVVKASYNEAAKGGLTNLMLAPGDVVKVEETPLTLTYQTIRDLFRFGFSTALF